MVPEQVLGEQFFDRPVLEVAPELLGGMLCRTLRNGRILRWRIEEVEAYDGMQDRACHAHKGMTTRTEVMFGAAGVWYIYLCYGVHWMLNIVTGPVGYPSAILIRGAGGISGPGRLTRALEITGGLNRRRADMETGLWIEKGDKPVAAGNIDRTARIGVHYAGPDWSNRPYRFVIK